MAALAIGSPASASSGSMRAERSAAKTRRLPEEEVGRAVYCVRGEDGSQHGKRDHKSKRQRLFVVELQKDWRSGDLPLLARIWTK